MVVLPTTTEETLLPKEGPEQRAADTIGTVLRQFGVIDCEAEHPWRSRVRFVRFPDDLPVGLHWHCGPEKPLGTVPDFQPRPANAVNGRNVVDQPHTIRCVFEDEFRIKLGAIVYRRLPHQRAGGRENREQPGGATKHTKIVGVSEWRSRERSLTIAHRSNEWPVRFSSAPVQVFLRASASAPLTGSIAALFRQACG